MELMTVRRLIKRFSVVLCVQSGGAGVISVWLGTLLATAFGLKEALIGGMWCAISAVIVINAEEKSAFEAALLRFVASLVACVLSGAIVSGLGYGYASLLLVLVLNVALISLIGFREGFRQSSIAIFVIYATGAMQPDLSVWLNALGRLAESAVGILVGLCFVLIFIPLRRWLASLN